MTSSTVLLRDPQPGARVRADNVPPAPATGWKYLGCLAAAGLVLFVGWSAQRRLRMTFAGLVFLVVIKFASPSLLGTFVNLFQGAKNDPSIQYRTHDYETAKELIAQNPWLGRGLGTWYAPKHEVFDNQYLGSLVDTGVIGLVAFMSIVLCALYATARTGLLSYRHAERLEHSMADRDLALAVAASIVVVLPTCATFDFLAYVIVTSLMFLLVGVAAALLRIVSAEVRGDPHDPAAIV